MEYQGIFVGVVLTSLVVVMVRDLFHRTLAVVLGILILAIYYRIPAQELFSLVQWDSLFYLFSVALVAAVLHRSGLFSWLVIHAAQKCKAHPGPLFWGLSVLALVCGGLLGGVPGLILLLPVTLLLAVELGLDPGPFLLIQVWGTSLGALITPLADPLAVVLGTHFHLSFLEYMASIPLWALGVWFLGSLGLRFFTKGALVVANERKARIMDFQARHSITHPRLLGWGLGALGLLVVGVLLRNLVALDLSILGLGVAGLLLVIQGPQEMEKTLAEVRGGPLFFLAALMILSELLTWQGWLEGPFKTLLSGIGDPRLVVLLLLWLSALLGGLIGALPVVILGLPWLGKIALYFTDGTLGYLWPLGLAWLLGAVLGSFGSLNWGPGAAASKETLKNGVPWSPKAYRPHALLLTLGALILLTPALYFTFPGAL